MDHSGRTQYGSPMATRTDNAEYFGRRLGRAWRNAAELAARAIHWLGDRGMPVVAAKVLVRGAAFALLATLLYAFWWLALIVAAAAVVVAQAESGPSQRQWFPKPDDHRDEPFYHPLSYNDDPDPRFEDE